jgi:hypothetical protein
MAGLGFTPPRRPLPRTVAPATDETLRSYLARLANANGLDPEALRYHLTGDRHTHVFPRIDVLAAVSGQPATSLRYAVLELSAADELSAMPVARRPRPGIPSRPHCTHCTAARGHQGLIWAPNLHEQIVCLRHRRWVGDGQHLDRRQLDLRSAPDVLRANCRHRRLLRRHSRPVVLAAFCDASYIVSRWYHRHEHDHDFYRQLRLLRGHERWRAPITDATAQAARYPQVVALTRLLASASWQAAGNGHWPGQQQFLAELRRTVAPGYQWTRDTSHGRSDPLFSLFLIKSSRPRGTELDAASDDDNETALPGNPRRQRPTACASAQLPGRVRVPTVPPQRWPTRSTRMISFHS